MSCKISFQPSGREVKVPAGTSIKDAINLAGFDFDFPCGGKGRCGKCRVQVLKGAVNPPTDTERERLEPQELQQGTRLACLAEVTGDLVVQLPYEKVPHHQILLTAEERAVKLEPHLSKTYVELEPPSLKDQRSDWQRLKEGLAQTNEHLKGLDVPLKVLRDLPQPIRDAGFRLTAVTDGREVLGIEPGDTTRKLLGIAFDIGTTTIVGYLLDLYTGKELSVASALNSQNKFGADVISRVTYASQEPDGLEQLQTTVVEMLNRLVEEAVAGAGVQREDIYAMTVVGNTCMHHLLLGLNPRYIALSPYVPVVSEPLSLAAEDLGLRIHPGGRVYLLPTIAGYVGADTVGVLLATEMDRSEGIQLALDIGTNGEIALGGRERLVACSAAAGPAFEGAQISSGMRGATGAIDHVHFGEDLEYTVIGGTKPQGICGSGLLDAVAGMLTVGILDKKGRLLPPEKQTNPVAKRFRQRVIEHEGATAFVLAGESETEHGRPILITQRDIRELQLAKGAMATGVQVLLETYGIGVEDVSQVLLAGAFGNYLDPHSACVIGLIPPELEHKVKMVGNAAGTGAKLALLSRGEYRRAADIAASVEYVELGAYPKFTELFASSMLFPEPPRECSSRLEEGLG